MIFSKKLQTGDPIVDNLISNIIQFVLGILFLGIPSYLLANGTVSTGNKIIDWIVSFSLVLFFVFLIGTILWKTYNKLYWASGRTNKYLKELDATLKTIPPGIRPLLAYIAKESAAHLIAKKIDESNIGEDVTINEYIKLLEESIKAENLIDVTFFSTAKPSLWGHCDTLDICKPIQTHAWDYFNVQKDLKLKNPSIRMRRYLFVSKAEYDSDDKALKKHFIEQHEEAKIDLLHLPPENISAYNRGYLGDMGIYWTSDLKGWVLFSNLKEDAIESNKANVQIIYDKESLMNKYSDVMKEVLRENRRFVLASDSSNSFPPDFLRKINIKT